MNSLGLKVEALPGAEVSDVAHKAVGLADQLGIVICVDFNGVQMMARSGDEPNSLAAKTLSLIGKPNSGYGPHIAVGQPAHRPRPITGPFSSPEALRHAVRVLAAFPRMTSDVIASALGLTPQEVRSVIAAG